MNVLLVRAGALGDILLLRTAVAALRAAGYSVSLLAPSEAGAVLVGDGGSEVGRLLPWEAAAMATLLSGNPSAEANRVLSPFEAVIAYTANGDLVRALGSRGARVIAHPPQPAPGIHAGRWLAQPVAAFGGDPVITPPVLQSTPEDRESSRAWLDQLPGGFLAIHPGSGSPRKNWPADRFLALVDALSADRPWLLVEGPADREAARALSVHGHAVRARALPVRVLGALLSAAGLYVGNDSGVSHLAAAFGAPALALFGPTDPSQWAPVGPAVKTLALRDGTMERLDISEVIAAAKSVIRPGTDK